MLFHLSDPKLPSQPKPSNQVPSIAHRATVPVKQQFTRVEFGESARSRPKPRKPEFLMESLQREGLWKSLSQQHRYLLIALYIYKTNNYDKLQGIFLFTIQAQPNF